MKLSSHVKRSWAVCGYWVVIMLFWLFLSNAIAAISGEEEKRFYVLFIFMFYTAPMPLFYSVIVTISSLIWPPRE